MNPFVSRETREYPYGTEKLISSTHSSKELEDVQTEGSGMTSHRTLNIFQDEYQLRDDPAANNFKQNKKNHIFIKMSARLNGIQLSPDNAKANKAYLTYQETLKSNEVSKKVRERNLDNSRFFQKIIQKDAEIQKLKEENRKLIITNQELQNLNQRKLIRSIDRFCTISSNQYSNQPISQSTKYRIEQQLSKSEQIKNHLEKRIIDLQSEIMNKQQEVKNILKQSQHQINLLYENLSKRLKQKQTQSYMNGKLLKQERQKKEKLEQQLEKSIEQKGMVNSLIREEKKQKDLLLVRIKEQQDELRKGKVVSLRLQHCENQLKYSSSELKRIKQEQSVYRIEIQNLNFNLANLRKQANSNPSQMFKHYNLKQSIDLQKQKQLQYFSKQFYENNKLVEEMNDQVMRLSLNLLNRVVSKDSF